MLRFMNRSRTLSLKGFIAFILILGTSLPAAAQLSVTTGLSATALATTLAGPGITISSAVLTCPAIANGTFTVTPGTIVGTGTTVFGLGNGILLTTGRAVNAAGPESFLASSNNSAAGDPALVTLAGATTFDACSLEFDVTPAGDTIKFNYQFGSEEYNHSTCGPYNDAFAFFISGPGITGTQNMALVSGTTIPVTVNSVNGGVPGTGYTLANCTSMGAGSPFTTYFADNTGGGNFSYKGFTQKLSAVHDVIPCNTYHIKLAVADASNSFYDSGVFIEAGSLTTPAITSSSSSVCVGGTVALTYATGGTWSSGNTAVATVNATTGVVTGVATGVAAITYTGSAGCFATTSITVFALPAIAGAGAVCAGNAITLSNATAGGTWASGNTVVTSIDPATGIATGAAAGTATITYATGAGCATTATVTVNPSPGPVTGISSICEGVTTTFTAAMAGGLWVSDNTGIATVGSSDGIVSAITAGTAHITYTSVQGCRATATLDVLPLPSAISGTTNVCIGYPVTLSDALPGGMWSVNNTLIATVDPATGVMTGVATGSAIITYTSGGGCMIAATVNIISIPPSPVISSTDSVICQGTGVTFTASFSGPDSAHTSFLWTVDGAMVTTGNPLFYAFSAPGVYTIGIGTSVAGCPDAGASKNIVVFARPNVNLGDDTSICAGSNEVRLGEMNNLARGTISWLWNTGQTSPAISITAPGYYYVTGTEYGCSAADTIWVKSDCYLDLPNAFTPNNDGVNDYFFPRQYLASGLVTFKMNIYNRWGQLIFETTSPDGRGWDGKLNDVAQPSGVFVYIIDCTFRDGQKEHHQGNVTLLR